MKNILCFGDSNTWGYNPKTKGRYPWGIRWTSKLQNRLDTRDFNIIEQGLCGRTTIYEDISRPDRKGIDSLRKAFEQINKIDLVIIMLGTNDCKKYYRNSAQEIAKGIAECLDVILEYVAPENILLVSPITLGNDVWKDEFDPEFDIESVQTSKYLKYEYSKVATQKKVRFLAASEYAKPSVADQEHLDEIGHSKLASAIYNSIQHINLRSA